MYLSHGVTGEGPSIEFLILAAGLVVLAVIFFVQKTVKPHVPLALLAFAFAMAAGAFAFDDEPEPHHSEVAVVILSPGEGETLPAGEPVQLDLRLPGGELVEDNQTGDPNAGHLHLMVDGATLPLMPSNLTPTIPGRYMTSGEHEITVEFVAANHARFDPPILSTVTVNAE